MPFASVTRLSRSAKPKIHYGCLALVGATSYLAEHSAKKLISEHHQDPQPRRLENKSEWQKTGDEAAIEPR